MYNEIYNFAKKKILRRGISEINGPGIFYDF
jgi:hypothetical protein